MRGWQQASTQPIVEVQLEAGLLTRPITTDIYLKNMGQGTAYVEGLKITHDGKTIMSQELSKYWPGQKSQGIKQSETQPYKGYLGPDTRKHPVSISWTPPKSSEEGLSMISAQLLSDAIAKTEISVCYCSVFERCWINDLKSQSRAKPVSVCPADYS